MARSWLDIRLERSGAGITADEYITMDKSSMCGVRAIGSAVGAKPQFEDKLVRMGQFKQKVLPEEELDVDISLPVRLAEIDSPLGRALKQRIIEYKKLAFDEVELECHSGAQVVLIGRVRMYGGEETKRHAMHVRPIGEGQVESLSDGGFVFDMQGNMEALVFRKKSE